MPSVRLWIYAFTSLYFTAGVPLQAAPFLRGDANAGGEVDISDAISTLAFLFSGSRAPACSDAADANDDGRIDITDPIFTLDFLFLGGVVPPAPYPACGPDLTPDELDCEAYAAAGCETLPALVEVRALSRHFVLAVFDAPVDAALLDPENFSIAGPGGAPLRIAGASREPSDPTKVLLATGEQEAVEYRLDLTSPLLAPAPAGGLNFQGSRLAEPFLAYAISLGSTSTEGKVLLTFSEAMASSALDIRFYQITNPDLRILRAEYGTVATANSTVLLTTEPQEEVEYTVRVVNAAAQSGGFLVNPDGSTASFFGIPVLDTTPPEVRGAVSTSATTVMVTFSEPLRPGAGDPGHYTITCFDPESASACPDLVVSGAALNAYGTQVMLTTLLQSVGVVYTVKATGLEDLHRHPLVPSASSASFTFPGGPDGNSALPRVVGAISTGNRTVVVQFSRPMSDSALSPLNYFIVQENVNPEVGALPLASYCVGGAFQGRLCPATDCGAGVCEGPRFLGADRLSVELKTLSQNEVTYSITAANVTDVGGNPLAPRGVSGGVLLDPTTATFPGTPPGEADLADSDGDGLIDNVEFRGWVVRIQRSNGEFEERQVTGDPFNADTDHDGLDDLTEFREGGDPRNPDTDGDGLTDDEEYNQIFSSLADQDSDDDGISDTSEVEFFKTNANLADSDGDGFGDAQELFAMNRDPRIADLPDPAITVDHLDLQLDERFVFTDAQGKSQTLSDATAVGWSRTGSRSTSRQFGTNLGLGVEGGFEKGLQQGSATFLGNFKGSVNLGFQFETTLASSRESTERFERSISKGEELTGSRSVSREIAGARISALVSLDNLSDLAFSLENLEVTVSATDPQDRRKLIPVATLVPATLSEGGSPPLYNLGAFEAGRGPIIFTSTEVYPRLVEDLFRDPRGLVFSLANFDLKDEFGRSFAFASQVARDRTVGLLIDFGDGQAERFFIASAPVRNAAGEIVGGYVGFEGIGPPPAVPLEYLLEEVLQLTRNGTDADGILAGRNGVADSVAQGDDVQLVPYGIDGLPEDTLIVSAGEDGILDTAVRGDDLAEVVTGYQTSPTCGPETPSSIRAGENRRVDTLSDPDTDDVQLVAFGTITASADVEVIGPGPNGFIDTAAAGDDLFVGPGIPCSSDDECPEAGECNGQEALLRFKHRRRGQFGRFWAVLLPDSSQVGVDFRKIVLRPGEILRLAFIQDRDRDGMIAEVESLFGSSDTKQDTDGDGLDDFSEVRVGWEVGVDGSPLRRVFPDPRLADSDGDGLSDREEQDFRRVQCECVQVSNGARTSEPCTHADDCSAGSDCLNVADVLPDSNPVGCSGDVTVNRTDPRLRDTDGDGVSDADEVLGYATGAGIVDPRNVIIAGADRIAGAVACPDDVCAGGDRDGQPCRYDRDCPEGSCNHPSDLASGEGACDDVQAVEPGTPGLTERTVVVAPGTDGRLHSTTLAALASSGGDQRVEQGDLRAATAARGDDQQIALVDPFRALEDSFLGRTIARPGLNGRIDSLPAGDDVSVSGQRLQVTDPLTSDTDHDQIGDGFELILGADPRDPRDGGNLADADEDGLTDGQEAFTGWDVRIAGQAAYRTYSNPQVADSDGDQLPDFAEHELRTDPNSRDTDRDGLEDFDELSAEELEAFERLNDFFPGFFVDPARSAQYGTDPLSIDSDGDGLSDRFELTVGWSVRVTSDDGLQIRRVFSDPASPDTDLDGLSDGAEYAHQIESQPGSGSFVNGPSSDPNDPDTDSDGRLDGDECPTALDSSIVITSREEVAPPRARCSKGDPLIPDRSVTVRYTTLSIREVPDGDDGQLADVLWKLYGQHSKMRYPGRLLSTEAEDCPASLKHQDPCKGCQIRETQDVTIDPGEAEDSARFVIRPGEGLLINGFVDEVDGCEDFKCEGGPKAGAACTVQTQGADCCNPVFQEICGACTQVPGTSNKVCTGGQNRKDGDSCGDDDDCCESVQVGVDCGNDFQECRRQDVAKCHMTFFKALSFESLQEGFSAELLQLNDGTSSSRCEFDLLLEIIVE